MIFFTVRNYSTLQNYTLYKYYLIKLLFIDLQFCAG